MRITALIFCSILILFANASGQSTVQKKAKEGLLLERGVGLAGELEVGKPLILSKELQDIYKEYYGLNYILDKDTVNIRHLSCDKPGCITSNNVGIDGLEETIIRRFGPPIQEKELKDGAIFLAYDGVAFKIVEKRVKVIYILPFRKKK